MKKPPFVSHLLIAQALKAKIDISTTDGLQYFVRRPENIISDFRKESIILNEHNFTNSKFSHYKIYQIIDSSENIERLDELIEKYSLKVNSWLKAHGYKSLAEWIEQQDTAKAA